MQKFGSVAAVALALSALAFNVAHAEPPVREAAFAKPPARFAWLAPVGPYWPDQALREGRGGFGVIDCVVGDGGVLSNCHVASQEPSHLHFGDALVAMAKRGDMRARPAPADVPSPPDGIWRFRVEFPAHVLSFIKQPADPTAIRGGP